MIMLLAMYYNGYILLSIFVGVFVGFCMASWDTFGQNGSQYVFGFCAKLMRWGDAIWADLMGTLQIGSWRIILRVVCDGGWVFTSPFSFSSFFSCLSSFFFL